jgi:hypothetical protein
MQPASTGTNLKDPAKRPARYGPVMTNDSDHIDAERTSGVGPRPGPGRRPGPSKRPCPKGLEHGRQRAQYPRGSAGPATCHCQAHAGARATQPLTRSQDPAGGPRPPIRAADRDSDPSRKLDRKRYLTHSTARETQPTPHLSLPGSSGGPALHCIPSRADDSD